MRRSNLMCFGFRVGSRKFPILSVIDQATKFQAAALLPGERGEDLVAALERCWVRHFGAPQNWCLMRAEDGW